MEGLNNLSRLKKERLEDFILIGTEVNVDDSLASFEQIGGTTIDNTGTCDFAIVCSLTQALFHVPRPQTLPVVELVPRGLVLDLFFCLLGLSSPHCEELARCFQLQGRPHILNNLIIRY